jgi:glutathione S-transferase
MPSRPILYIGEKNVSSWSMRPWVALTWKGVDFEERTIRLVEDRDQAERLRISPTGLVPVLHHDGLVIHDSLAILEYVEETFPPPGHSPLWPVERAPRARARSLAATMHSAYPALRESMSFNLCFLPERPRASLPALAEARDVLELWEGALAAREIPGPFLVGPFSGADVLFAPVVWRLTAFGVPASRPAAAYMEAVLAEPAVEAWMAAARALPPVAEE